ncbi:50S ribosomal protein L14 [Candidatus Dojkabacteria bacterium]|nr:50S ribosomal protein L14 [Candidatus Dojkabacteria bacterium]
MIQKLSRLKVADNTGAKELMVINVLSRWKGNYYQRFGSVGEIVVGSVKKSSPFSEFEEGSVVYGVIVRTKKEVRRKDGSYIRFDDNAVVIIGKESQEPKGTRVFGPIAREVKDKGYDKIASLAPEVL